ncbi:iron-containing alcohol dehydrogenase family protein [Paenibacillus sp. SC116]|uniref:iron-containing alcohol dehydrogenase family protein n=1 Tax=Paenibacillus sp. SC116 TaxID=2968986 RepID=UPI00215AD415|nr:iron-containing alcohol dehydrogenase family protein [Paenibacillus sp. SC116]MCR8846364.1 iron-containing alcohol dehydrogenase family protein [Paenibacillus sp. SC116]
MTASALEQQIVVRGAPALYYCEDGILSKLESLLQPYAFRRVLVIHGERSLKAAQPYLPQLKQAQEQNQDQELQRAFEHGLSEELIDELVKDRDDSSLSFIYVPYQGECTLEEAERLAQAARNERADVMVAIGGGKVLDVAKAAAYEAQLEVILVPTLASNCAAWTPLSVFYNEQGQFTNYVIFPKSSLMVLVEPRISLEAPVDYLRAGIADTIAKWYEADVLIRNLKQPVAAVQIAHLTAQLCHSVLLEDGLRSIQDAKRGELSPAFVKVLETIIMTGGMVGGFGDHLGRIAGAHSVHNGLTVASSTHHLLHGDKVAYGILVQLVLEGNVAEVEKLLSFYQDLELPYRLSDLGLSIQDEALLKKVASGTTNPQESIHLMWDGITAESVYEAIIRLEQVTQHFDSASTGE